MRGRLAFLGVLAVGVLVPVGSAADGKTPGRTLAVRTAIRATGPAPNGNWHAGYTNLAIAGRNGELETGPLTQQERDQLDATIDWTKRIGISVTIAKATTGYSIQITRIALQKTKPGWRQFCVLVRVQKPRPGQAVERRVTFSEHIVTLDRRPFKDGFTVDVPRSWVMREANGSLLGKSALLTRPALCHS